MAKLFQSLVVLGAGICGTSCGSAKSFSSGARPDETTGSGTGGSTLGGAPRLFSGGQPTIMGFGGSGASFPAAGGMPNPPDSGSSPPDAGTLAQWDCFPASGYHSCKLDNACSVNPWRPRTSSDCTDTEWFECVAASFQGKEVYVNCSCVPMSDAGCTCSVNGGVGYRAECKGHDMLCGCAVTGILVH